MNPQVEPATTATVYTDDFFRDRDVIVNALDNVQARLFMDNRCITAQRCVFAGVGTVCSVQFMQDHAQ